MTSETKDVEDAGPPQPPVDWTKKNVIKTLFFAQVSPLIAEGTVRRLEPTDLCHLDKLDSERVRARVNSENRRCLSSSAFEAAIQLFQLCAL